MVILIRLSTYVGLIVSLIHRNRVMFACFISPCTALNRHHTLGSIDYPVLFIPSVSKGLMLTPLYLYSPWRAYKFICGICWSYHSNEEQPRGYWSYYTMSESNFFSSIYGALSYLIGVLVAHFAYSLFLSQQQYILDILQHDSLNDAKIISRASSYWCLSTTWRQAPIWKPNLPSSVSSNGWCFGVCHIVQTSYHICNQQSLSVYSFTNWQSLVCCQMNPSIS